MKYCGIKRLGVVGWPIDSANNFNPKDERYQSLGDKIRESVEYGADIGSPAVVQFDEEGNEMVDILTDPNHDFFDIAEEYGMKVDTPVPPKADEVDE